VKKHIAIIVGSFIIIGLFGCRFSFADMWEPYQFEPKDQEYEYEIINYEEEIERVSHYILKIDLQDDGQLEISVQTTWMADQEELGSEILGGWWATGAFGLTMAFINPMYAAFFGGLDLHVGNKMSFFGAGVVHVTGTETVAGREGFVCELLNQDGGNVQGRYVVDPSIPLPLKTELFDDQGARQFQTELLRINI
jgi:hypothetical protein